MNRYHVKRKTQDENSIKYVDNIIARYNINVSQAQYDALYLLAYNRPILLTKDGAVDRLLKEGNNNYSEWKEAILNEYRQLPGWGEFGNGWTNRIEDLLEVYFYEDYERTH